MLNRFARFSLAIFDIDRCWHKLAAEAMAEYGLNSPHAVNPQVVGSSPTGDQRKPHRKMCFFFVYGLVKVVSFFVLALAVFLW